VITEKHELTITCIRFRLNANLFTIILLRNRKSYKLKLKLLHVSAALDHPQATISNTLN
jgi:hypothetical protein